MRWIRVFQRGVGVLLSLGVALFVAVVTVEGAWSAEPRRGPRISAPWGPSRCRCAAEARRHSLPFCMQGCFRPRVTGGGPGCTRW